MGVCRICGAKFGMLGGGEEPYTTAKLQVCNVCGEKFKKMNQAKEKGYPELCKQLADELLTGCSESVAQTAIKGFLDSIYKTSEMNKVVREEKEEQEDRKRKIEEAFKQKINKYSKDFKMTTGYNFEGYKITKYKGLVSGEVVIGTGIFSELASTFTDEFGLESGVFADKMKSAKQKALTNLMKHALYQEANALIGIDFDYLTFSSNMIGVSANGTAVLIEKVEDN